MGEAPNIRPSMDKNVDTLFGIPLFPNLQEANEEVNNNSHFSVADAQQKLTTISEEEWILKGKKRALSLFHAAAEHIPAYKDFLKKNQVKVESIKTIDDFNQIPVMDKENYLRMYPLEKLVWNGRLQDNHMIVASSGSYGPPFLWPRNHLSEMMSILEHELGMVSMFALERYSTLVVVCFAMGMHIAGTITMQSIIHLNKKGYPISVITPGHITENILSIVSQLAKKYDQVILAGYPPYLKEVIDRGKEQGIKWEDIKLRFLMAGEGFNESWRTYMAELTNTNPEKDYMNIYGSADAAAMGQETYTSIILRRKIVGNVSLSEKLFKEERMPYLYQYYPEHQFFESVDNELVLTTLNGIPLIRYNIHDKGGILTQKKLSNSDPIFEKTIGELRSKKKLWNLPFVYLFGRSNQMAVVYGANVYLEHVRQAIESQEVREIVSGKLNMYTDNDENQDLRFYIDLEYTKEVVEISTHIKALTDKIHATLLQVNSEYRSAYGSMKDKVIPLVRLISYGDERFYTKNMKYKWTNKKT